MHIKNRRDFLNVFALLAAFVCLALTMMPVSADTTYPTADTFTFNMSPSTNFQSTAGLLVKYASSWHRYSWLQFNIGSIPVSTATFYLYSTTKVGTNLTLEVKAGQASFSETGITWDNQPEGSLTTVLGTWNNVNATGWYSMNVTSFYNANLGKTVCLRVKSTTSYATTGPFFEDRENRITGNSAYRPRIDFTVSCVPPSITTHPTSQTKCTGQSVTFSVAASGTAPLGYQWKKGGTNISGATSSSYTINSVATGDAGSYNCYVSNACGNITSNAATLTVNPVPAAPNNPGAAPITTSSITWTWKDNSTNETGFKVYADAGAGPPTTLRGTTAAGATSWAYSGLAANTQYAFQVAATSGTCDSAKTANLARYTLALPPVFGTSGYGRVNCDRGSGSSSTWYPAGTAITFTAVNGFGTGQAKASKYQYVWNTTAGAPSWTGASEWTSGTLVKNESASGSYYLHLRACNADGVPNSTILTLGPYQIDADVPSSPIVTDDGDSTTSETELHATWTSSAGPSGVADYQYAISTSQTEVGIITGGGWESTGTDTEATRTGLSLEYGETYYILVKAKSGAGVWSAVGSSDGITVSDAGTIQALGMPNAWVGGGDWYYDSGINAGQKGIQDGIGLNTTALLIKTWGRVTFADADYFYIDDGYGAQDGSGHIGIRVEAAGLTVPNEGAYVVVTGISLLTTIGNELQPKIQVRRQADILVIE